MATDDMDDHSLIEVRYKGLGNALRRKDWVCAHRLLGSLEQAVRRVLAEQSGRVSGRLFDAGVLDEPKGETEAL